MADLDDFPMDDDPVAAPATKPSGKHGIFLVVIVGILVMVLAPLASWFVVKLTLDPQRPATSEPKEEQTPAEILFNLDSIVVNVAGTRMTRVLRIQPHLVLSDQRLSESLQNLKPIIKDRVMMIASQRSLDQLETMEDREAMKKDIANEINILIRDRFSGSVVDVVFSDFLIQ